MPLIFFNKLRFSWDENKAITNLNKHGVSFDEAATAFYDGEALFINDPEHSISEQRFVLLGLSNKARLLVVCHCYRDEDREIRIISARKATSRESDAYAKRRPL